MSDNQIIRSIKNQIQLHPWPWLAGVTLIGFSAGVLVGAI